MNLRIIKACLTLIVILLVLQSACLSGSQSGGSKNITISSLEADSANVYPKGASEIKCVISAPQGDTINYTWSADSGSIVGEGADVQWQAPNDYGNYHVMVTVKDTNGGNAKAFLTLSVVPRPARSCCGGR